MLTDRHNTSNLRRWFPLIYLLISFPSYGMHSIVTLTVGSDALSKYTAASRLAVDETLFVYHPEPSSKRNVIVGGFVGEEFKINRYYAWQFGLALYQASSVFIKGEESQAPSCNPDAINYWRYQYKVSSRRILFENKISYSFRKPFHPYLLFGLGQSFNTSSSFHVTPQNSGEVATAIFNNHKNKSFTYTLGFGMDIHISKTIRLGLGYRFADLGKFSLGKGTLDTGSGGEIFPIPALKPKNIINQEVLIQLTYVI